MDRLLIDATDMYYRNKLLNYESLLKFLGRDFETREIFLLDFDTKTHNFQVKMRNLGFQVHVHKRHHGREQNCSLLLGARLLLAEPDEATWFVCSNDLALKNILCSVRNKVVTVGYEPLSENHVLLYQGLEM